MLKCIKNQKGAYGSVEFLIVGTMIFILLFVVVDYWTVMMRIQQGEHLKNFFLDRTRLEGYLSPADQIALTTAFDQVGFTVESIDSPPVRVIRNINVAGLTDPPIVWLEVNCSFNNNPFLIEAFLNASENHTVKFKGETFTEYVGGP